MAFCGVTARTFASFVRRRTLSTTSGPRKEAEIFLRSRGYDKTVSNGIIGTLEKTGVRDSNLMNVLRSLGGTGSADSEDGLVALGLAVQREIATREGKSLVKFYVEVPSRNDRFECVGFEGQTIKDFVLEGRGEGAERLAEYVECACSGVMACSTCHVIVHKDWYEKIGGVPCDAELDMLELAYGETETSRLGCQVTLRDDYAGLKISIPDGANNLMDDIPFPDR